MLPPHSVAWLGLQQLHVSGEQVLSSRRLSFVLFSRFFCALAQ
jgi:hypothetical protein